MDSRMSRSEWSSVTKKDSPARRIWDVPTLALFALLSTVRAQHTEAQCSVTSLSWSFNSIGQSPCLIAAFMANPCSTNDDYDVPAIGPGFHYNPSQVPSICECSSVVYSLYSACAACQNATIGPWTTFIMNCTKTEPDGQYPLAIPPGTALPAWAYQLVTTSNRFNLTLAQSVGDSPENITAPSTTSSSQAASRTTPAGSTPPGQTTEPGSDNSNDGGSSTKKTPVGAIVGGVVGGIGGVVLIGGLIAFFLIRRKKNQGGTTPPGEGYGQYHEDQYRVSPFAGSTAPVVGAGAGGGTRGGAASSSPPPSSGGGGAPLGAYTAAYHPVPNPVLSARPYDPEDPSTFPPTPGPGGHNWSQGEPTLIGSTLDGPIGINNSVPGKWAQQHEVRAEV